MSTTIKTNISRAYWWGKNQNFVEARDLKRNEESEEKPQSIVWFDRLFDEGIVVPEGRALTMLVTGPPGTGKSTLALELCQRATMAEGSRDKAMSALYVSNETSYAGFQHQCVSFGWQEGRLIDADPGRTRDGGDKNVWVIGSDSFHALLQYEGGSNWVKALLRLFSRSEIDSLVDDPVIQERKRNVGALLDRARPEILVIDSLNSVPDGQDRSRLFQIFGEIASMVDSLKLVVVVADSGGTSLAHEFWGYSCDTIVRLDRRYDADYMVRTIEVLKARHQQHVWGVHQLKVYGKQKPRNTPMGRRRQHPHREEGGLFIFPSIHYYLSEYKRTPFAPIETDPVPVPGLTGTFEGFPRGRCSGLVGGRGGHKSHLAYHHVLARIKDENEHAIVVSLRDDEEMATATMKKIYEHELGGEAESLQRMIDDGRLELIYFPPGYITPEEFFHRIYIAVHRMKAGNEGSTTTPITLMFNSLDQLGSRFPLCAKENIFVPGLIEMLSAEQVTSLFIGVEAPGQPKEQYGLMSMAEVIISAQREALRGMVNVDPVALTELSPEQRHAHRKLEENREIVRVRIQRIPGGQGAGQQGVLELIEDNHEDLHRGLVFLPVISRTEAGASRQSDIRSLGADVVESEG